MKKSIDTIQDFSKGAMNKLNAGSFYHSQNIEIDDQYPYLTNGYRMFQEGTGDNVKNIIASANFYNTVYASNADGKIIRKETSGWVLMRENSKPYGGLGLLGDSNMVSGSETGYLYYVSNNYIGRHDGSNWVDDWQRLKTSNNGKASPTEKFLKFLCFGNGKYLAVYDLGSSSFNNERLTLPDGYVIRWIKSTTDYLIIGADHASRGGIIIIWDGISTTYNSLIDLGSTISLGADVYNNICYIITNDGWISRLEGYSGLVNLSQIPDADDIDFNMSISHDAVKFYRGVLHFGISGNSVSLKKRYHWGGVWAYNPKTNAIFLKNILSDGGIIGIVGRGVTFIGSIIVNSIGVKYLRVAWSNGNDYFIDVNTYSAAGRRTNPYGSFIITNLIGGKTTIRKRFIQVIMNMMKELPDSSNAKIIIRYSEDEEISKKIITNVISGASNYFILSSGDANNVNIGDEVYIVGGGINAGAGQIRNITKKELSGANYKFTVDRSLSDDAIFKNISILSISEFKLIEIISGNEYRKASKLLKFHNRSKQIRLKVELYSPTGTTSQSEVGISNISTVFVEDKVIKI